MILLGISAFYHDSSVAIIKDGKVLYASQEERFSRLKNDSFELMDKTYNKENLKKPMVICSLF